jgi:copper(I)-binding protein
MRLFQTKTIHGQSSIPAFGPAVSSGALALFLLTVAPLTAVAAGAISVEKPWMRFIIKARPAAGYMTLRNSGDTPVALISASSPACGMLMLHQSKEVNGIEKMLPVKSVTVPAHGDVSFAPGGYHLMCMKPQAAMQVGHSVPVTLKFADGETVSAQYPVKGPSEK